MNEVNVQEQNDMDIHLLKREETEEFLAMSKEVFPDHFLRSDQLENTRQNKNKEIFVLKKDESLCGFLILNYMEQTGYLTQIGVRKRFRGRGYANLLMNYALDKFKAKNFKRSVLNVLRDNYVAFNLYKKFGYIIKTRTWSFKVRYNQIPDTLETKNYSVQTVPEKRFTYISENYPVNLERLYNLKAEKDLLLEIFHDQRSICFTRFDPAFPGCYPFELKTNVPVSDFWGVIAMLRQYKQEHNFLRVTFLRYEALAKMLQSQNVELIDDLYYMEKKFDS